MKNAVPWDVMHFDSCKNLRFGGTYHLHHQSDKNHSSETLVLTKDTRSNHPDDGILH
jgi:hypothetical protein